MKYNNINHSFMNQVSIAKPTDRSDFQYINKINQLSMEQEILLLKQIKNGDPKALQELVIAYQRFVVGVAKRFKNNGLTLHDLIIKGNRGLAKAALHFDESRGFTFTSYAIWSIRLSIIQAFVEQSNNKPIPLDKIGLLMKGKTIFSNMEHYFQREPTPKEIHGMLDFQTQIRRESLNPTSHHMTNECFKYK